MPRHMFVAPQCFLLPFGCVNRLTSVIPPTCAHSTAEWVSAACSKRSCPMRHCFSYRQRVELEMHISALASITVACHTTRSLSSSTSMRETRRPSTQCSSGYSASVHHCSTCCTTRRWWCDRRIVIESASSATALCDRTAAHSLRASMHRILSPSDCSISYSWAMWLSSHHSPMQLRLLLPLLAHTRRLPSLGLALRRSTACVRVGGD